MNILDIKTCVAAQLAQAVEIGLDDSIGLGWFTPDGRQLGVSVEHTGTNKLRLSDGGETWADLWGQGCAKASPRPGELTKIKDLCVSLGLAWDPKRRAIFGLADRDQIADVARRIAVASITIDGWRYFIGPTSRGHSAETIVRGLKQEARQRAWMTEANPEIPGGKRTWRALAKISRDIRSSAITILHARTPEEAVQNASGWMLDAQGPVVFVAPAKFAHDLERDGMFNPERFAVVSRQERGPSPISLSRTIVEEAIRIAA